LAAVNLPYNCLQPNHAEENLRAHVSGRGAAGVCNAGAMKRTLETVGTRAMRERTEDSAALGSVREAATRCEKAGAVDRALAARRG
jgi:hypothetical protein